MAEEIDGVNLDPLADPTTARDWVLKSLLRLYAACARRRPLRDSVHHDGHIPRFDAHGALGAARLIANHFRVVPFLDALPDVEQMPLCDVLAELQSLEQHPVLARLLSA